MKDYVRAPTPPTPEVAEEKKPAFRWQSSWNKIAAAVVLVLVLGVVGYLKTTHSNSVKASEAAATPAKKNTKSKSKPNGLAVPPVPEPLEKPQFEFYDILAEKEGGNINTLRTKKPAPAAPVLSSPAVSSPALAQPSAPQTTAVVSSPAPAVSSQPSSVTTPVMKKQYMIQVASYQEKPQAQKVVQRLRQAQIQARLILTPSSWWRIDVGPFESRKEAESMRRTIQDQGFVGGLIREIQK